MLVAEMRLLRYVREGVPLRDGVRNEYIRGSLGIVD